MNFDERVVFSEDIKNREKTIKMIKKNKGFKNLYIVAFRNDALKPEIYPTLQFKQKKLSSDGLHVIGVFKDESEALEMIRKLCELAVEVDENFDLREAFLRYGEGSE